MSPPVAMGDETFKADLVKLIPNLRAFAYSLAGGPAGDDLAQEAMLKAWKARASYEPGSNLKAWVFTILRNLFFSEKRRSWRTLPLDPTDAERALVANDDPSSSEELVDVRNAMQLLPATQREALILIGAAGLSYEEAAGICGCEIGTVKSRVSRARSALLAILARIETGSRRRRTNVSSTNVFEEIMHGAASLQKRLETKA